MEEVAESERYEYAEGNEDEYEEEYDEGDDFAAEAEEMARRLQEQLRADIVKAQLEVAAAASASQSTQSPPSLTSAPPPQAQPTPGPAPSPPKSTPSSKPKRHEAAILTIKAIMSLAAKDNLVHDTLSGSIMSVSDKTSVLDIFNSCISHGSVPRKKARQLSDAVLSLAKSDVLFASLRNSDAPAIELDKGKRKRDVYDDGSHAASQVPPFKRMAIDQPDLLGLMSKAVKVITQAFVPLSSLPTSHSPDPAFILSLHVPLHQVFLFAVTSSPRAGERTPTLQELAGLIQMLGVLSGIPIGSNPAALSQPPTPWGPPAQPDLGTAVYPCLVLGCTKIFHRLYSLRTHQRLHTLIDRPFRCTHCPASFVRNHDLKRHIKLHEKKAWRCSGCGKVFSRRDAIKRHKDNRGRIGGKGKHGASEGEMGLGDSVCAYAEIEEVEVDKPQGEEDASRRAKMWNEIVANQLPGGVYSAPRMAMGPTGLDESYPEEGQVDPGMVEQAQIIALQLHGVLQAYVTKGLGRPAPTAINISAQATLASVIAQNQHAQMPQIDTSSQQPGSSTPSAGSTSTTNVPSPLSSTLALSEEQTRLLEQAIAQAALAAQAQAEAEAALEEEVEGSEFEDEEY